MPNFAPRILYLNWHISMFLFGTPEHTAVSRLPKDTDYDANCWYQRLTLVQTQITLASIVVMIDIATRL